MDLSDGCDAYIEKVYQRSANLKKTVRAGQNRMKKAFGALLPANQQGDSELLEHYCLRSTTVSHFLVNTFDADCARFSPGLVSMLMAAEQGVYGDVQRVDFGKGLESYKQRLATAETIVGEGCVDLNHTRFVLNQTLQRSRYRFLNSAWSEPVRTLARKAAARGRAR